MAIVKIGIAPGGDGVAAFHTWSCSAPLVASLLSIFAQVSSHCPRSHPSQNVDVSDDTPSPGFGTCQGVHSRETVGYTGTAFCLDEWDKA